MSIYSGPELVVDGLALYLDAVNLKSYPGTGNTWFNLMSDKTLNGSLLNGCSFSNDSFIFDGIDDYISLGSPTALNFSTEETTIAWYYPENIDADRRSRVGNRQNGFLTIYGSQFGYEGMNADNNWNNNIYTGSGVVELNKWQQLSFSFKGLDNVSLYKNGTYVTGKAVANNQISTGGSFFIGTESGGGWGTPPWYAGKISLVLNYNRALTAAEIRQNFNALRGRFGI